MGFALKQLSGKLASPAQKDLTMLRNVGKYWKGTTQYFLRHEKTHCGKSFMEPPNEAKHQKSNIFKQPTLIEVCTDSDWANDASTRSSTSCVIIYVNGQMVHFQSRRQRSVTLSSMEAELMAGIAGAAEGKFLKNLIWKITGQRPELVLRMDSSSALALLKKRGLGKARHISTQSLWLQQQVNDQQLKIAKIAGTINPADIGTKPLTKTKVVKALTKIGVVTGTQDDNERYVNQVSQILDRSMENKVSQSVIRMVIANLLVRGSEGVKFTQPIEHSCITSVLIMISVMTIMVVMFWLKVKTKFGIPKIQKTMPPPKRSEAAMDEEDSSKKVEASMDDDVPKTEDEGKPKPKQRPKMIQAEKPESSSSSSSESSDDEEGENKPGEAESSRYRTSQRLVEAQW